MHKRHSHTPAHMFYDNTPYFITGAIYKKRALLKTPELKYKLSETIKMCFQKYKWRLQHWVILDNHYHLMALSNEGKLLSKITKEIHITSSRFITSATHCEKPVWWNYWDYCPRNEKDYYIRLNYLLYNPIKHGYVIDLKDYKASSFATLMDDVGREKLLKQFCAYPQYKNLILREAGEDDF